MHRRLRPQRKHHDESRRFAATASDTSMNYQEEFNQGYAGQALPNDPHALAAWNAGARTREENERVARVDSASASDPSVSIAQSETPQVTTVGKAPVSPDVALSAAKWWLGLGAFVVFAPIALPASTATPFAAGMLKVFGGAHRPSLRRTVGAAFVGLLAYFGIAGAVLAPKFSAFPIERIESVRSLLEVLAPHLGALAMGQLLAVAGYAVIAAGWLARGVPKPDLVARAFMSGVVGLLMFVGCLLALASALGL